jgi:hypothetical protein
MDADAPRLKRGPCEKLSKSKEKRHPSLPPEGAVSMLIVVVMTMVVAMVMMARNSHHAFCAADNATGHSTDYAPDCRANRTGRTPARGRALLTTPDNALSLCGERHQQKSENAGGYQLSFHWANSVFWRIGKAPRNRDRRFAWHGWRGSAERTNGSL